MQIANLLTCDSDWSIVNYFLAGADLSRNHPPRSSLFPLAGTQGFVTESKVICKHLGEEFLKSVFRWFELRFGCFGIVSELSGASTGRADPIAIQKETFCFQCCVWG